MATNKPVVKYIGVATRYIGVATSQHSYDSYVSDASNDPKLAGDAALELYEEMTGRGKEEAALVVYHVVAHSTYDVERPVEAKLTLRKTITY